MRTLLTAVVVSFVFVAVAIAAPKEKGKKKHGHHAAHTMVASKMKTNGTHQLHKNRKHTVSAHVKDGKIAGLQVKHDTKGDVAVKKYKSKKKYASLDGSPSGSAGRHRPRHDGIAYAYEDDDGNEEYLLVPVQG
jgi:hypothetical protein